MCEGIEFEGIDFEGIDFVFEGIEELCVAIYNYWCGLFKYFYKMN